jgi:hypothetical protein
MTCTAINEVVVADQDLAIYGATGCIITNKRIGATEDGSEKLSPTE